MKQKIVLAFLAGLFLFLPSLLRSQTQGDAQVTVVFTGDVHGYLEPCG